MSVKAMEKTGKEFKDTANRSATSFILDCEEEAAKGAVLENYKKHDPKFELPRPIGRRIVVALHVRPEQISTFKHEITGETKSLVLPDSIRKDDKFMSCTGCVIAIGPDAYSDEKWFRSGPYCKVGDFVAFPRHAGHQYNYMGIPVHNRSDCSNLRYCHLHVYP